METVPCPINGSREFKPFLQAPDRFDLHGQSWQLVRSAESGIVMLNPRPDPNEIAAHYPSEAYDPFLHDKNARTLRDRAYLSAASFLIGRKARVVMQGIKKPSESTRILEVGCSTGRLLLQIHRDFGVPLTNLFGVETDRAAAATARSTGIGISESDLSDADFNSRRFDRIIFWHALEHLHRIGKALDQTRELLAEDGQLIIAVPNIESLDARGYGPNWIALDAPRHLYHFSPDTLSKLLEKHGLSILEIGRWLPDTLYNVWYSEKLERSINGKPFGIGGIARAAFRTTESLATGRNPKRASSMIVRAVRMKR